MTASDNQGQDGAMRRGTPIVPLLLAFLAIVLEGPGAERMPQAADTSGSTPFSGADGNLWFEYDLHGPVPVRTFNAGDIEWRGYSVRLCNRAIPTGAFTYVGADASLRLQDGRLVRAQNGYGRASAPNAPAWLADPSGWVDKATIEVDQCAEGWLVFQVPRSSPAVAILWHGVALPLQVPDGTSRGGPSGIAALRSV